MRAAMLRGYGDDECRMIDAPARGWRCRGCGMWNDEELDKPEHQPCADCGRLRDRRAGEAGASGRPWRVRG